MYIGFCLHGCLCEGVRSSETRITYRQLWTGMWVLGTQVLGKSSTLDQSAISPAPAAKDNHMFTSGSHKICHILKICFYYFLEHLCTNKALQSHNSTGMVLCKSSNINLENGVTPRNLCGPFPPTLQMELGMRVRHEGGSHLSMTLSAKLDLILYWVTTKLI